MKSRQTSRFIILALPLAIESGARGNPKLSNFVIPPVDSSLVANSNWNSDADGSWSAAANWSAGVPDAIDASANFGAAITAPRTVTVDAPEVVGSINFNSPNRYTIAGPENIIVASSTNHGSITDTAGSHTISAPMVLASDTTFTSGSATLTINGTVTATDRAITTAGAGTVEFANIRAKTLKVNAGTARILPNGTSASVSSVGSLTILFGSGLDLANNDLLSGVDYESTSLLVNSGNRGFGGPSSPGAIFSSTARADSTHHLGLGVLTGAQYKSLPGHTTFDGLTVNDTDSLVKYTMIGDTNFDGTVNALDFNAVASNFGKFSQWFTGDLNYDGFVNTIDYTMLAQNFAQSLAAPASPDLGELSEAALGALVPEPNWVGIAGCVGIMMRVKRRRKLFR